MTCLNDIIEVVLAGEINENGEPAGPMDKFYPDDAIYTAIKLNYRLKIIEWLTRA